MKKKLFAILLFLSLVPFANIHAQGEIAATLEVISAGVTVQRVNTANPLAVQREAIVGVGDIIRTDATGQARIIFFADGTETELLPSTEYRIETFEGDETSFRLSVSVLGGQTVQRLSRLLDNNSSYDVQTPGMELVARGTEFKIRVEDTGRSAMLVTEGTVGAGQEADAASVEPGFGIRAEEGGTLSDVVRADDFDQLDSALDGCTVAVTTPDDVQLNVRLGPSLDFARVGTIAPQDVSTFFGVNTSGNWYRIEFRGGFGWVLSSTAEIQGECAGLRVFEDTYGPEDVSLYTSLGEEIDPASLPTLEPTVEPGS